MRKRETYEELEGTTEKKTFPMPRKYFRGPTKTKSVEEND